MPHDAPYRVMLPWGRDKARHSTFISAHRLNAVACAAIDRETKRMVENGWVPKSMELIVLDQKERVVD